MRPPVLLSILGSAMAAADRFSQEPDAGKNSGQKSKKRLSETERKYKQAKKKKRKAQKKARRRNRK